MAKTQEKQEQLPGVEAEPQPTVEHNRMYAKFVKAHPILEDDERFLGFELSFALTEDHRGILPSVVEDQWDHVARGHVKRSDVIGIAPCTIEIALVADSDEGSIVIQQASIARATLSVIEEKGSGEAKKVLRFSFRALAPVTKQVALFAAYHFSDMVWIKFSEIQTSMKFKK